MQVVSVKSNLPSSIYLKLYRVQCWKNVLDYINTKSMQEILKHYSLEDINDAISCIHINNGSVNIPDGNRFGLLLRLLQFGGYRVKALNILTKTVSDMGV